MLKKFVEPEDIPLIRRLDVGQTYKKDTSPGSLLNRDHTELNLVIS